MHCDWVELINKATRFLKHLNVQTDNICGLLKYIFEMQAHVLEYKPRIPLKQKLLWNNSEKVMDEFEWIVSGIYIRNVESKSWEVDLENRNCAVGGI